MTLGQQCEVSVTGDQHERLVVGGIGRGECQVGALPARSCQQHGALRPAHRAQRLPASARGEPQAIGDGAEQRQDRLQPARRDVVGIHQHPQHSGSLTTHTLAQPTPVVEWCAVG